ncbi:hypothetical protein ACFP7A_03495 [Sporolactobacillus kofuensis]|uniref:Uncharacterized protein n=1 Tax=Sporolactobacillus kofuensis TaxID=269672 RepID=A0ABW1WAT5_9BACL|nr:hypothetical protein [Sporolactobacillus kofuensis]MCO7174535.1 hypothetical protein [Sporolactobacillus kofuensis]
MVNQKDKLNSASLEDRQKFYRNKALKLEQAVIFAREEVVQLKSELEDEQVKSRKAEQLKVEIQRKSAELKKEYDALNDQLQAAREKIEEAEKKIADLKRNQRADSDLSDEIYHHRVEGYEKLLTDMQKALNEKVNRIEIYERRIAILERRLKNEQKKAVPVPTPGDDHNDLKSRAVAFLNYVWMLNGFKSVIQGDVIIENTGSIPLKTPTVCFRFHPGDLATLKGRVVHEEDAYGEDREQGEHLWVILDTEEDQDTNQNGEIWVRPLELSDLLPGQSIAFNNFQIPIDHTYSDSVRIECFVFFGEDEYKIKCGNQIVISMVSREEK